MKGRVGGDVVHSRDRIRRVEVVWLYCCLPPLLAVSSLARLIGGDKGERTPIK